MSYVPSRNFSFLAHHDPRLVALGTQAEEHFAGDPTVTLFNEPQRKWLARIADQIKHEVVVDRESLEHGEFKTQGGGFARLNKVFDGKLESLLGELADEVWKDAG